MQNRIVISLGIALVVGLLDQGARAASYRKTDGTVVDPMTSATCSPWGTCNYDSAIHPFLGPALGPGVRVPLGANLGHADLRDADLREADLRGASLQESDIRRGDFRGADMRSTGFLATVISNGALDHADLRGNSGSLTHLEGADLHSARLQLYCSYTNLSGANLSGAILRNSHFSAECGGLTTANFENADLRGSRFVETSLPGNMNGADLRGASFVIYHPSALSNVTGDPYYDSTTTIFTYITGGLYPAPANWINLDEIDVDSDGAPDSTDNCRFAANPDQADMDSDQIGDACDFSPSTTCLEMGSLPKSTASLVAFQSNTCEDWSWVEQPAAYLPSAVLTETYLRSANLSGALMVHADLAGADLTAAQLVNTNLSNANLESAVLAYTHLAFANMIGANLAHADLDSADVEDLLLNSAQYDEATVFPSGRKVSEPPWGLPNDLTPWDARMIPVPEPRIALMISSGVLGAAASRVTVKRRRQAAKETN